MFGICYKKASYVGKVRDVELLYRHNNYKSGIIVFVHFFQSRSATVANN